MAEKMIQANGIDICTEAFGDPRDVPILLVMGATASMLFREDGFAPQARQGARRGDSGGEVASARGRRPRAAGRGVGPRRRGDPRAHGRVAKIET